MAARGDAGSFRLKVVSNHSQKLVMQMLTLSNLALVDRTMRNLLGGGPVAFAAQYHLDGGGSRTRAILALDAGAALGLDPSVAASCASAAELLHNASLVHDDLQEHDALRRGRAALWRRFDAAAAICSGDLMISAAFASLAAHPNPADALMLMHKAIAETARGQSDDLRASCASLTDYRALAAAKTGPLLALPVRLALCAAKVSGDAVAAEAGGQLAIAYQTLDDLADRDADCAAGRINICVLLEAGGLTQSEAAKRARSDAQDALTAARRLAVRLPNTAGIAFCNLADRLDSALTEFSHAA